MSKARSNGSAPGGSATGLTGARSDGEACALLGPAALNQHATAMAMERATGENCSWNLACVMTTAKFWLGRFAFTPQPATAARVRTGCSRY
jgi:stage V sporulation protein SpoVS